MKTVFRIAMMLCVCLLCAHVSFAEEPWFSAERYYQGDPNYVLVQERQEVRMYVDVSSIVSKIYEPPEYEISAVVMVVGPQPGAQRFLTETWHYHYDPQYRNRQMFVWDEHLTIGDVCRNSEMRTLLPRIPSWCVPAASSSGGSATRWISTTIRSKGGRHLHCRKMK